jgi:hypothetical protein
MGYEGSLQVWRLRFGPVGVGQLALDGGVTDEGPVAPVAPKRNGLAVPARGGRGASRAPVDAAGEALEELSQWWRQSRRRSVPWWHPERHPERESRPEGR